MFMILATLPDGYFYEQFLVKGRKGHALVSQVLKKVFWIFSIEATERHVEMVLDADEYRDRYSETEEWSKEVAQKLREGE